MDWVLEHYAAWPETTPRPTFPDLAMWLHTVNTHLAGLGDDRAALAAAQQAADTYRVLAEADPEAYLPKHARSRNNLAGLPVRGRATARSAASTPRTGRCCSRNC